MARRDEWNVFGFDDPPDRCDNWKPVLERAIHPRTSTATRTSPRSATSPASTSSPTSPTPPGTPAEVDHSLRMLWFWHPGTDACVRSAEQLVDTYYKSVGSGTGLLLGLAPDRRGLIPDYDIQRLREWKGVLDRTFADDLAARASAEADATATDGDHAAPHALTDDAERYWMAPPQTREATIELRWPEPVTFNRVMLQEALREGQRIAGWSIETRFEGQWQQFGKGTTIGHKRLLRLGTQTTDGVRLRITGSRAAPTLRRFGVFRTQVGG